MAEFKEVVKKWREMCDYHFNDDNGCKNCPLENSLCDPTVMTQEELEKAEEIVMNYNYEVPVYPTILELVHYIANRLPAREDGRDWAHDIPISELVMERIPYEVAEEFNLIPINECGLHKYVENEDIPPSEWR